MMTSFQLTIDKGQRTAQALSKLKRLLTYSELWRSEEKDIREVVVNHNQQDSNSGEGNSC